MKSILALLIFLSSAQCALALGARECIRQKGIVVNTMSGSSCVAGKEIGTINDTNCPCICCMGEKIIDCAANKVTLSEVCNAGDALHFRITTTGKEVPLKIHLNLGFDQDYGNDTAEASLASGAGIVVARYHNNTKSQNYTKVRNYNITYKDAPLSHCSFPLDRNTALPIPIVKCNH